MERLLKSEFVISIDPSKGQYGGSVCKLKIDYENKTYEIIPPEMKVETSCDFPLLVADLIHEAYEKAKFELYPNE